MLVCFNIAYIICWLLCSVAVVYELYLFIIINIFPRIHSIFISCAFCLNVYLCICAYTSLNRPIFLPSSHVNLHDSYERHMQLIFSKRISNTWNVLTNWLLTPPDRRVNDKNKKKSCVFVTWTNQLKLCTQNYTSLEWNDLLSRKKNALIKNWTKSLFCRKISDFLVCHSKSLRHILVFVLAKKLNRGEEKITN